VNRGSLIFVTPEVRSCAPEAPSPRYSVHINGFLVDFTIFMDFVSTYLHLHSYSFAVPLQDKCTDIPTSSKTFKTFQRSYGGTRLSIGNRTAKRSDWSPRVCVSSVKAHTQALCTRRFTTFIVQSLFGDRFLNWVDPNVRSTAFV
jgi:hypothetical protein